MYFEPTKKTYYRFPSAHSISDLDSKLYFPDKHSNSVEDTRFEAKSAGHVTEKETYYDL